MNSNIMGKVWGKNQPFLDSEVPSRFRVNENVSIHLCFRM